jgi:SSS family solute:Na+ symporter/sodium/proline symporter
MAAFLWKRATAVGALASIVTGTSVTLIWTYVLPDWSGFTSMHPFLQELTYPAAGLSILALVAGSLLTPAPPRKAWEQFFNDED